SRPVPVKLALSLTFLPKHSHSMIGHLRSLFGKSATEPKAGASTQQAPAAGAPEPSQETPAEAERRLKATVGEAECRGGDDVGLGDALIYLANFLMQHNRPAEAEAALRRVLAIEEAAAPARPDRLVSGLANLASACRALGKKAEAEAL